MFPYLCKKIIYIPYVTIYINCYCQILDSILYLLLAIL